MSELARLHTEYLKQRQHTLSIAGKPFDVQAIEQAEYVKGEADELLDAVNDVFTPANIDVFAPVRREIADVVLATVTLAKVFGVTVEDCIAEKTAADRGRG